MKTAIVNFLTKHPNARKRTIASALGVWQCDTEFLDAMWELVTEHRIAGKIHRDFANWEYYETFCVVEG